MSTDESDSEATGLLLERIEQGDMTALDHLFARHRRSIRKLADWRIDPRIRARVDPSDIVQETELEALKTLDNFLARRPMPFRLWLLKTAYQRLAKAQRRHMGTANRSVRREIQMPDRSSLLLAQRIMGKGTSPSEATNRQERAQQVGRAISLLNEHEREVVLLRIFEGLTSREVGCLLDMTAEAAQKRFARGVLKLRTLLQDAEDSTDWSGNQ